MTTHVVRGMPYGTVRFGKKAGSFVLPHIMSGNRAVSLLIDSDGEGTNAGKKMQCGSFTGKPVDQDPNHAVPLTSDGKPKTYAVEREVIFHLDESDFHVGGVLLEACYGGVLLACRAGRVRSG